MVKRWGAPDDAKLVELFRAPRNGVDPKELATECVKAVHRKYFRERTYASFAPLYREKAHTFLVGHTLDGHRKREYFF